MYLLGDAQKEGKSYEQLISENPRLVDYIEPNYNTKKRLQQAERDTGMSLVERNEVIDHARAHISALGDLLQNETLKGSMALRNQIDAVMERFGEEQVLSLLAPAAAEELIKVQQVRATEKAAKDELESVSNEEAQVRAELKAAQEAIEAMRQGPAQDAE